MAEAEREAEFLSSMQAVNENAREYNDNTGDASVEQIDSSDEYDPAQDVQDISLPGPSNPDPSNQTSSVASSNNPSRPASTRPQERDPVQSDSVKSPTIALQNSLQSPTGNTSNSVSRPTSTVMASNAPKDSAMTLPKIRLPHDTIGILEDRIAEDEKGDIEAWLSLVDEHKIRGKIDDARKVYERFLTVFPLAAEQWVAYVQMENEAGNKLAVENIFNKKLKDLASLPLWTGYLNHIRRYFNMATDKSGNASQINHAAYEAVLDAVGTDKDAGQLWLDYIQFIRSSPGVVGGTTWQDQQKMDLLRKAYQRAVCIPTQSVETVWKDYTTFEMGLNKITGRKFIQERSPHYISARSSYTELQNITRDLKRTTIPSLPPTLGFYGDVEYMAQVDIWKKWIQWEKDDPLVLQSENPSAYKARIMYAYKQALMALYFWPEMWFDAADFCFENNLEPQGDELLAQGIAANPESCLLAFKQADKLEQTTTNGNNDDSKEQRGIKVRAPYNTLLDALYALITKAMEKEAKEIARVEDEYDEAQDKDSANGTFKDDDMEDFADCDKSRAERKRARIEMFKAVHSIQISTLNKTVSHVWIALMRAMQRMQGKGKPGAKIGGSRQVFADARKRGRITSLVWTATALLEFHNGDAELAKRLFERGMKLFPDDEEFALEYLKLLTTTNDNTNARVTFETTVDRLLSKPETSAKAKPLFSFYHRYEAQYGELSQVVRLEKRMREAFPDDPKLSSFSQRYISDNFDPTAIRPLISPAKQAKPKIVVASSVEIAAPVPAPIKTSLPVDPPAPGPLASVPTPPIINAVPVINSPKRPLPVEDFSIDHNPPRKLARGESPLAGAAGRRLNQAKANRQNFDSPSSMTPGAGYIAPPLQLPRDVLFLLSIIPPASTYQKSMIIPPEAVVRLMRETNLPASANQLPPRPPTNLHSSPSYSMPPGQYPGQLSYP